MSEDHVIMDVAGSLPGSLPAELGRYHTVHLLYLIINELHFQEMYFRIHELSSAAGIAAAIAAHSDDYGTPYEFLAPAANEGWIQTRFVIFQIYLVVTYNSCIFTL
jgi:hypothetical protein